MVQNMVILGITLLVFYLLELLNSFQVFFCTIHNRLNFLFSLVNQMLCGLNCNVQRFCYVHHGFTLK